jgi:hypothetical protein
MKLESLFMALQCEVGELSGLEKPIGTSATKYDF